MRKKKKEQVDLIQTLRDILYKENKTITEFCLDNDIPCKQFNVMLSQQNRFYPIVKEYIRTHSDILK